MSRKQDEVDTLKRQVTTALGMMGDYLGHELLVEKLLGTRYVFLSYLCFLNRQPMRFNFHSYKPKDSWVTFVFTFDDRFSAELADTAKPELRDAGRSR